MHDHAGQIKNQRIDGEGGSRKPTDGEAKLFHQGKKSRGGEK
jgi:hypothetical protein